jgi:LacI family transcriptional regulator
MRAVAENLGVSIMTVSRALRNAPNVASKTRERIMDEAKRLNFQPDPALGVLNAYRHGRRDRKTYDQIAFITNFPQPNGWKKILSFARYFEGASRRAEQLGYHLEPFWIGDPALTPKRASQILRDRGIRGLLIGPLVKGNSSLSLEWDWFSVVALGRSLISPKLTTVSTNHFQGLQIAWDAIIQRGYRRIGFAITHYEDVRTQSALRAAYLLQQSQNPDSKVPLYLTNEFSAASITRWAKTHRPEVILSSEPMHYDLLPAKLRADIGFVHLNIDPASAGAGIDQAHELVGEHAAALLHLKLLQRQTGVLKQREMFLVDGSWKEGVITPAVLGDPIRRTKDEVIV